MTTFSNPSRLNWQEFTTPSEFRNYLHALLWHGVSLLIEENGNIRRINPLRALYERLKSFVLTPFGMADHLKTPLVQNSVVNLLEKGIHDHLITEQDQPLAKELARSVGLSELRINEIISNMREIQAKALTDIRMVKLHSIENGGPIEIKKIENQKPQGLLISTDRLKTLQSMASNGNADAMFNLGMNYLEDLVPGIGSQESLGEAVKWFHSAYKNGSILAGLELASLYLAGKVWGLSHEEGGKRSL